MLYPLLVFGGFWFWTWVVLAFIIVVSWAEEGDSSCAIGFGLSIAAFYALSEPPVIDWYWIASYLLVGFIFFLAVFRYRLGKLRAYLQKNPQFKDGNGGILQESKATDGKASKYIDRNMERIYRYEPSYVRFFDRTFCWPFSMLKIFFGEFVADMFEHLAEVLNNYKKGFLS